MLKDFFSFAEQQEEATYGLGYKLTVTRNKGDAVSDKTESIADTRIKIDHIHWYVPHYTPFIQQQGILSEQNIRKPPTELQYIDRSVFFSKEINIQNLWNFEVGSQEIMNVLISIIVRFQQRVRQDTPDLSNDYFWWLRVTRAQCIVGTEKNPDAAILIKYIDDYSQGYAQLKEAFRGLTKDDILQLYITDDDFRSSNTWVLEIGYNIFVFDIRYQQIFTASQPFKV